MCKAIEYSNEVLGILNKAKCDFDKLRKQESKLDRMLSDIEHKLENKEKFNLYEGYEMAKSISIIRQKRRVIKGELQTLRSFIDQLGEYEEKNDRIKNTYKKLKNQSDEKIYNNRVLKMNSDIIQEVERKLSEVNL